MALSGAETGSHFYSFVVQFLGCILRWFLLLADFLGDLRFSNNGCSNIFWRDFTTELTLIYAKLKRTLVPGRM